MSARGPYAAGRAKREEILHVALSVIADHGYNRATVQQVAEVAGVSKAGLLHHFSSKEELLTEVLDRREAAATRRWMGRPDLNDPGFHFASWLAEYSRQNQLIPGLAQLYVRLLAEATDHEHPAHTYFLRRYKVVQAELADVLAHLQRLGRLTSSIKADVLAADLLALMDGLQMRALLEPSFDMAQHLQVMLQTLSLSHLD